MKARYLSLAPLICWQTVPRPIAWDEQFGREAPLTVEIGFGNGEFIVRQAQAYPEQNFVGIELEWASVQRGLRKIKQTGTMNVRLMQVDARVALERLFFPQSLRCVYTLFPCPWPKERHAKHRLFSHPFLQLLNSRLVPEGSAQLVTDHQPYMAWVLDQVPGTGFEVSYEPISPRFSTKYERKWHAQGQEHFYSLWLYKCQAQHRPLIEDMPLQTYRIASFAPDRFQPANTYGPITVKFKDFLYDAARQRAMIWVFAVEEGLTQDFWIELARDRDDRWHIRPARGCSVVPTLAVQRALDLVREAAQRGA
jgi:tRNA (guanine-N7-)-methyltransferase